MTIYQVPGSKGGFYAVQETEGGGLSCPCSGFQWRGRCRHVQLVQENPNAYQHTTTKPKEQMMSDEELMIPTTGFTAVAERPKSLGDTRVGTEDIGADEIRLPRLSIAQGLTPELTEGNSNYIEGLRSTDMFNNMTGEVYGRGPLMFVPLRRDWRRIEFVPRSEGGGIRDMNVPKGDPRLNWTGDEPPAATEFFELISLLLRPGKTPEPIVISVKTTNKFNRRAIDKIILAIKMRNADIYAGLYTIESKAEKNDKGTFGVPIFKNAGFIPVDTPSGKALYDFAQKTAAALEGKEIAVDREPGDDTEFDPSTLEGQAASKQTEM